MATLKGAARPSQQPLENGQADAAAAYATAEAAGQLGKPPVLAAAAPAGAALQEDGGAAAAAAPVADAAAPPPGSTDQAAAGGDAASPAISPFEVAAGGAAASSGADGDGQHSPGRPAASPPGPRLVSAEGSEVPLLPVGAASGPGEDPSMPPEQLLGGSPRPALKTSASAVPRSEDQMDRLGSRAVSWHHNLTIVREFEPSEHSEAGSHREKRSWCCSVQ